jgi:Tfp pilus assembly protein PilN
MMKKRLNFIPRELQPKMVFPHELIPIVLFAFVVLFIASSSVSMHYESKRTANVLQQMKDQDVELTKQIQVLSEQNKKNDQNVETFGTLQKVLSRKNYWSEIFKELSILIPQGIWLTNFTNSGSDRVVLKGESSSPEGVAKFLRKLEGSQHFSGARMNYSEKEKDVSPSRYKFEMSVPVKLPDSGGGT